MGIFVTVMTALRARLPMRLMPTAAIVPRTVATTDEITAMISELAKRRKRFSSRISSAYW